MIRISNDFMIKNDPNVYESFFFLELSTESWGMESYAKIQLQNDEKIFYSNLFPSK